MNLRFNDYLFFNKSEVGTKRTLLKKYKVRKNSYAGNVLSRVYDSYFGSATNLQKEFSRYYKKEFGTCKQYLICRFNMPEELAQKVCSEKKYYVDLSWKGEQIRYSFSYDEDLRAQFWDFVGGIEYED